MLVSFFAVWWSPQERNSLNFVLQVIRSATDLTASSEFSLLQIRLLVAIRRRREPSRAKFIKFRLASHSLRA
jgi:hypothetical protein